MSVVKIVTPQETCLPPSEISSIIYSFKDRFALERHSYIKKKIEDKTRELAGVTRGIYKLATGRRDPQILSGNGIVDILSKRQKDAIDMQNGIATSDRNKNISCEDDGYASVVLLGYSIAAKKSVRPIVLPKVEKLPHFTTWAFLRRNEKMTEDQSVLGRRRIYYDQNDGEALICSDSEEERIEKEEEKEFVDSEDYILRMTVEEAGLSDMVLHLLANFFSRKPSEVKARYEYLIKEEATSKNENSEVTLVSYLDRDLDAALDSFDNLFCRRCFVFDCQLHGCSQDLIFPAEKQLPWFCADANEGPCGLDCYLAVINKKSKPNLASHQIVIHEEDCILSPEESSTEVPRNINIKKESCKNRGDSRSSKWMLTQAHVAGEKRPKKRISSRSYSLRNSSSKGLCLPSHTQIDDAILSSRKDSSVPKTINSLLDTAAGINLNEPVNYQRMTSDYETAKEDAFLDEHTSKIEGCSNNVWRPLEKALFEKGLEIFGSSSCLIARNLMNGLRSCLEVFQYMNLPDNKTSSQPNIGIEVVGNEAQKKPRYARRRGRVRRLKYTCRSGGHHSIRKRISEKKEELEKHYTPCNCQSHCGKSCPCSIKSGSCEKFCGCSKNCLLQFRGCHCSKSQCTADDCPCYAARRECDPDICHNCWVGCGDGSIGVHPPRASNHKCMNMKLLLRQHQKVLLGRSSIVGWGAFLKDSVKKNDFIGEYTGEVISHFEADKRGKVYDRENYSFLFNLNDLFVVDAYRKGNKLKFANHSLQPNCVAKVIMVGGDHRIGIYALTPIHSGDELLYDYRYDPDNCPAWAKDLMGSTCSKKGDGRPSGSRAKKHT
ncbi:unnamed protein product [Cuscuta europaea]|uniref:Uncharacterized protein n=2 Tax=Cuscuta europaea TaxID=41803 RepID=A0A9P1E7F2_CUSEU|nr:unnamed protein product [Cuscuta europaea]